MEADAGACRGGPRARDGAAGGADEHARDGARPVPVLAEQVADAVRRPGTRGPETASRGCAWRTRSERLVDERGRRDGVRERGSRPLRRTATAPGAPSPSRSSNGAGRARPDRGAGRARPSSPEARPRPRRRGRASPTSARRTHRSRRPSVPTGRRGQARQRARPRPARAGRPGTRSRRRGRPRRRPRGAAARRSAPARARAATAGGRRRAPGARAIASTTRSSSFWSTRRTRRGTGRLPLERVEETRQRVDAGRRSPRRGRTTAAPPRRRLSICASCPSSRS